ncbi:MAG: PhnD/SsuA/transferrin family substrate-binding protein, partial [Pseudomonadota bacterium]
LLGQTCGLPLTLGLAAPAQPFARPSYGVEGCGSGTYRSVLLAREAGTLADFQGARAAINGWDSQSGCNALKDAVAGYPAPFFREVRVTGAHRASADALWAGEADLCALDAVAWALYQMAEPARAAVLHPVGWSAVTPSLPYVTSPAFAAHAPALVAALEAAIQALPPSPALPVAVMPASLADYAPIAEMNARVAGLPLGPGDG